MTLGLLKLSLLLLMLNCCWAMVRHAPRRDNERLHRTGLRMRALCVISSVLLVLWLVGAVVH